MFYFKWITLVFAQPMTRITTSPSRVYRERYSPVRIITPSARIYRRDVNSPVRLITSPGRIVNIRVRPSTLSKEFDRIDRKYRSSPIGVNDTEEYLNSAYSLVRIEFSFVATRTLTNFLCHDRTSMTRPERSAHPPRDWWRKSTSQSHVLRVSPVTDVLQAFNQATAGKTTSQPHSARDLFSVQQFRPWLDRQVRKRSHRERVPRQQEHFATNTQNSRSDRDLVEDQVPRHAKTVYWWVVQIFTHLTHETLEAPSIVLVRDRFQSNSELTADTNFDTQIALNVRWFYFLDF